MKTIYVHKKNQKEFIKVKEEGNTVTLQQIGSEDFLPIPRITLTKWYDAKQVEGDEPAEAIQEEVIEVRTEEKPEEVIETEEIKEDHNLEVVEEIKEEPQVIKEVTPKKALQPRKPRVTTIPENATCIESEVEGIQVKFYEYEATDTTFKTEAVVEANGNTYRLGSIFKNETGKAFSSYYFKNDSATELPKVQRKGIKSAAAMLSPEMNLDSGILEAIMNESRNLEIYKG